LFACGASQSQVQNVVKKDKEHFLILQPSREEEGKSDSCPSANDPNWYYGRASLIDKIKNPDLTQ